MTGTHGAVFDTQASAEAFLHFQSGGALPPLGPQTVKGEPVWGTAPQAGGHAPSPRPPSRRASRPAPPSASSAASTAAP